MMGRTCFQQAAACRIFHRTPLVEPVEMEPGVPLMVVAAGDMADIGLEDMAGSLVAEVVDIGGLMVVEVVDMMIVWFLESHQLLWQLFQTE
jgi:hypothetical protein